MKWNNCENNLKSRLSLKEIIIRKWKEKKKKKIAEKNRAETLIRR